MTSYEDVYGEFLNKIDDIKIAEFDDEVVSAMLLSYLKYAIVNFSYCRQDLSDRDDEKKEFNVTLTGEEIEILSEFMVLMWLNSKVNNLEFYQSSLNTSDFEQLSKANQLEKMKARLKEQRTLTRSLVNEYTLKESDYDTWAR